MRVVVAVLAALLAAPPALFAQHVLTIPGGAPTRLATAAGGTAAAEVIQETLGGMPTAFKHLSSPRYEAIEVSFSLQQCTPVHAWISATLAGNYTRKDGEIQSTDAGGRVLRRLQFFQAFLSGATLPATGAQGDAAGIGVTILPEFARLNFPGGRVALPAVQAPAGPVRTVLSLAGLPAVEVRTEPITIAFEVADDAIGDPRDYVREPGQLEIPNLQLFIPEDALGPFLAWYTDFVVQGNNDQSREKSGTLAYLSQNRQPLATLHLGGVGIAALRSLADGGWEAVLYAEQASISSDIPCAP